MNMRPPWPPCGSERALKAASDENHREVVAANQLLKDAISKREADLFRTDEEVASSTRTG